MAGLGTIADDWSIGITDETLQSGVIPNTAFVSTTATPNEPRTFKGDVSFTYSEDATDVKNYLKIKAYILPNGSVLTRLLTPSTGSDTYPIPKASDIKRVARYLDTRVVTKTSTTVFTIPVPESEIIGSYSDQLATNALGGRLHFLITTALDSIEHDVAFTISGTTITLDSAVTNLAVNDRVELISCFDIVKDGTEQTVGLPIEGYCIKYIKTSQESKVKFGKYDVPPKLEGEKVIIYFNELANFQPQYSFDDSINRYDIQVASEDLTNLVLTEAQIEAIINEYHKYLKPLEIFTLTTYRPTYPQKGWKIPINVTNIATGLFTIIGVDDKWIDRAGQKTDEPLRLFTVTLASYVSNLAQIIAGLNRQSKADTAIVDDNLKNRSFCGLKLTCFWSREAVNTLSHSYTFTTNSNSKLVLYYPNSDYNSTTITDSSGNGHNGTLSNAGLWGSGGLGPRAYHVGPITATNKINFGYHADFSNWTDFTIEFVGRFTDITPGVSVIYDMEGASSADSASYFGFTNIGGVLVPYIYIFSSSGASLILAHYATDFNAVVNQDFYLAVTWDNSAKQFKLMKNQRELTHQIFTPGAGWYSLDSDWSGVVNSSSVDLYVGNNRGLSVNSKLQHKGLHIIKEKRTVTQMSTTASDFGF